MHQQRQILCLAAFTGAVLLGASASHRHRIDRFQVAGIRRQVDMNFLSAPGDVLAGRAHVVLHVARPQYAARIHILKLGKHLLRRTPCHMNNDVEPSAMAHAHHQFHRAALAGHVQNLIHRRQQRRVAFEGESFVAQIARLQRLLKQLGAHEQVERAVRDRCRPRPVRPRSDLRCVAGSSAAAPGRRCA